MHPEAQLDTFDLADPNNWTEDVPWSVLDERLREAPVLWTEREPIGYWSVCRHADIASVARDRVSFTSAKGIYYPPVPELAALQKDMLVFRDPPSHTQLRTLVSKSFTPRVVRNFDGWIREQVRAVIEKVKDKDEFDWIEDVAAEVPAQVIASIMGVKAEDRPRFQRWAMDIFGREEPGGEQRFIEANLALAQFAMDLREEKRVNQADDMTSALVELSEGRDALTDGEYQQFVWILLMAGYETTHTAMSHAMRLMVEEPAIYDGVRAGAAAGELRPVVEEVLRLITPVLHFGRHATRDVEIGGQPIKEGEFVVMWFIAANRDPEVFPDPYQFKPERSPNPHMAFGGGGPHHCLGNHIARLELEILLEELVASGIDLKLNGHPQRGCSAFVNTLRALPVAHA